MGIYDYVSLNIWDSIDYLIEYSEFSQDVVIRYPAYNSSVSILNQDTTNLVFGYEDEPVFGYEDIEHQDEDIIDGTKNKLSRGAIIFNPDRRLLRKIGILLEDDLGGNSPLPIIGFFKQLDNVVKDCNIILGTFYPEKKQIVKINHELQVIDIGSKGNFVTGVVYYKLAPYRGK